jgi:hypothetical protein
MIKHVKLGDIEKFVCAAGIISYYVGDASQPLHVSKYHYGGDIWTILPKNLFRRSTILKL